MADIRINSLPTTATSFNTDDYIALDGASGGTRKMLAATLPLTDVTFGSSGPSAKSSIAARASRQGLVFDGTSAATFSSITPGSGNFTVAAWVNVPTTSAANRQIIGSSAGDTALFFDTSGLAKIYISGQSTLSASAVVPDQKWTLIVYTRSGTTGTFYQNAIANGVVSDSNNYSTAWSYFGARSGGGYTTGTLIPLIYNRALSAAEVVALYEAGVPAGADYNNAGQTISNATWTNGSSAFSSFSSASGAAISGTSSGFATAGSTIAAVTVGKRVRVSLSLTLNSGQAPQVYLASNANQGPGTALSNAVTLTAGSNVVELVSTSNSAASLNIAVTAATDFAASSIAVVGSGLLLAPDAGQAGGGLTWYDTSGNAANITLPASGVSWNVPSSRYLGGNWTTSGNLTVTGTSGITTTATNGAGLTHSTAAGSYRGLKLQTSSSDRWLIGANDAAESGSNAGSDLVVFSYSDAGTFLSSALKLVRSTGNLLVGTTTDGGQKLQVSGTALITATSDNLSIRGIAGGTARGFDLRQSGDTEARVLIRGDSRIFFGNGSGTFDCYVERNSTNLILGSGSATALTLDSSQNATFAGTVNVGTGASNSSYQNIYTNKSENTAGPVSITLPANCTGTVRVSSYQSGVGRSFRTIPFLNFGGTVTLGTSDTTVVTADPVTSVAAGTGAVTLNLVAANTNVYWGIDVVKA